MLIQYNNHNRGLEPDYFELFLLVNYRERISIEEYMVIMAQGIERYAVEIIRNYNPRISRSQILSSVKGFIGASYEGGGSMDQSEVYTLNEITPDVLFEITEKILQSNSSVIAQELTWTFVFIPDSFYFNGGGNIRVPVQVKFFKETWKEHNFNNEPISCAAYALTTWENKKRCERIAMMEKKSLILQKKLGWEKYTTNYQFEEYLEHKKNLKIVIINMKTLKGISYIGKEWKFEEDYKKNTIFLFNSLTAENGEHCSHYSLISGPLLFQNKNYKWCANCDLIITATENHHCEKVSIEAKKRKMYECEYCEKSYYDKKSHKCFHLKCKTCQTFRKLDEFDHVCVLQAAEPYDGNGEEINAFAYDLESIIKSTPSSLLKITRLKTDENGKYPFTESVEEIVECRENYIQNHKVNLVCFKNIITGEEGYFFGDDCIEKFITFLYNYKDGKCIAIAHNASGYDSRFIFEESLKFVRDKERKIITRGTKILQLKLGSLTFIDSLPHLPGSLKKIGKDFGCKTEKGHFPFLFNQPENYNYVGSIPDLKYFGIDFCKTEKDYNELLEWHASWQGRNDWNFMNEFLKYCKNDVDMLAEICKGYMLEWVVRGIQPWLKPTGPGVVHQYIKMVAWAYVLKNYPPPTADVKSQEYLDWFNDIARNKFWCVLTDYENNFARAALRGGRTEVKMMHYKLSEEDYQKGVKIAYPDVKSLYPSQQILQEDIPVGKPTVHIYDKRYLDCNCKIMKTSIKCNCDPERKIRLSGIKKRIENGEIIIEKEQPTDFSDFFGIVCVTLQPPKDLYHPVLILKNEDKKKCIPTLEDEAHVEIVVDTPNFIKCIEKGYKVLKIHSYHKYKKSNLMKYATIELFIQKEKNSRDEPTNEEKVVMTEKWGKVYGDWAVKLLQESFGDWGNNPAKRLIYKIAVNSGWGKMCQRTKLPICDIIDYNNEKDLEIYKAKLNDCGRGVIKFKGVKHFGGSNAMLTTEDYNVRADLHDVYLPAGLFIPAYGRLKLYEQLEKLGLRVIYMDTDSIIYIYIPGEYNVPLGDGLGEWELEDYCTKTDIMEIVGMAAKTYGLKMRDGSKMVKAKGLTVNRNCENIVNFENMKNVVLKFCNDGKDNGLLTPQTNFKYVMGQGVSTEINFKHIGIKKGELKGILKNMKIYPFGYDDSLIK